jgi:hypothetical protein
LTADDKIGTMLPCNVIVHDPGGGQIEIAAINPAISMQHVGNQTLHKIAESVIGKLKRVVAAIRRLRQSTAHLPCAHVAYQHIAAFQTLAPMVATEPTTDKARRWGRANS